MRILGNLLPKAATSPVGGARRLLNQPLARYGMDMIASRALEAKMGKPDGCLENILQWTAPKYYNAFKVARLAAPGGGIKRAFLTLMAALFPRHMAAVVLAKESGKRLSLFELVGVFFAPDAMIAWNATRSEVFGKGKAALNQAKGAIQDAANATGQAPTGLLHRIASIMDQLGATGQKGQNAQPLQFPRLFQKLKDAIAPATASAKAAS